jgi:hypothetical protein
MDEVEEEVEERREIKGKVAQTSQFFSKSRKSFMDDELSNSTLKPSPSSRSARERPIQIPFGLDPKNFSHFQRIFQKFAKYQSLPQCKLLYLPLYSNKSQSKQYSHIPTFYRATSTANLESPLFKCNLVIPSISSPCP